MRDQPARSQRQGAARSSCALALLLAFGLGTSFGTPAARAAPASMSDVPASAPLPELEPFVDGIITAAMAQQRIAGVQVAIVRDGSALLIKGYGVASSTPPRGVDPERSLFRIASISKTFTWIALMQLAERGRLRLEDPVNQHLPPELAIPADGWEEPVRIIDLMNHTAGFEEPAHNVAPARDAELRPAHVALREQRPRRVRKPGRLFAYSNYGADLAGAIIAHVSGVDFETYVERHLLGPLGMEHTTFREPYGSQAPRGLPAPMPASLVPDIAQAFIWQEGSWEAVPYEHVLSYAASGSASSTASDMARYMIALLAPVALESAGVLTEASSARLRRESFRPAPGLRGMHHGFFDAPPGVHSALGYATLAHGGNMACFESNLSLVPELGLGVFVTTNSPTGVMLSRVLQEYVLQRYFPPASRPPAPATRRLELSEYAGDYRDPRRVVTRLEALFRIDDVRSIAEGAQHCLHVRLPSDEAACFAPIGGDLFQKRGGDARLAFLRGTNGEITHVVGAVNGERVRVFGSALWLRSWLLAGLVAALLTLWPTLRWGGRMSSGATRQRRAARAMAAAAGFWLAFYVAGGAWQLWHADDAFHDYPQPVLVLGLALLLGAVGCTALAGVMLPVIVRNASWSAARRATHGASVVVWLLLTATLHRWNVIGFHF